MFIAAFIHNSQKVETAQISISDELITKMWYIHLMKFLAKKVLGYRYMLQQDEP